MFEYERITTQSLKSLIGHVEWIYEVRNLRGGLDVVFRVDGELHGLRIYEQEHGRVWDGPPRRFPSWRQLVIEPLPRKRILSAIIYIELANQPPQLLLNDAERTEWERLSRADEREREARKRRQREKEEARERRQYEQLRKKFEEGE